MAAERIDIKLSRGQKERERVQNQKKHVCATQATDRRSQFGHVDDECELDPPLRKLGKGFFNTGQSRSQPIHSCSNSHHPSSISYHLSNAITTSLFPFYHHAFVCPILSQSMPPSFFLLFMAESPPTESLLHQYHTFRLYILHHSTPLLCTSPTNRHASS